MDENAYRLAVIRYILMAGLSLIMILVLGYRFGEAQRVKLLATAKDPMLAACALDQSAKNTMCAMYVAKIKE